MNGDPNHNRNRAESIAAVMPGIDRHTEICDRFYLPAGDCLFVIVHQVANALTRIAVT